MAAKLIKDQRSRSTHTGILNQVRSLQCPICYKLMTEPKLLSCGHTFCFRCLSKIIEKEIVLCALCRAANEVIDGDAEKLPTNHAFQSVVEEIANTDGRCDVCDTVGKADRISYCNDCNMYICPKCLRAHEHESYGKHSIIKKRRSRHMSSLKIPRMPCKTHPGNNCIGICVTCKVLVCKQCSITEQHNAHELQDNVQFATKVYASATPLKSDIKSQKRNLNTYSQQIRHNELKASYHIDSIISQINVEYNASIKRLEEKKSLKMQACKALQQRMCELSDDLVRKVDDCHTSLDQIHLKIQSIVDSPFRDMCAHSSTLESSTSQLISIKDEADSIKQECGNMTDIFKEGNTLAIDKNVESGDYDVLKLTHLHWVRKTFPLSKPEMKMTCLAVQSDGRIFVGNFDGGVVVFKPNGSLLGSVDFLRNVRIIAMSFGKNNILVLRNINNEISIFEGSLGLKSDVKFETIDIKVGGLGDISLDQENVYASYRKANLIHIYKLQGGKPWQVVDCLTFAPEQIIVMPNFQIAVMGTSAIIIIDRSGIINEHIVRKGCIGYPAIAWDKTLLVAWVDPRKGSVEFMKYSNETRSKETLLFDTSINLSGRNWCHCKVVNRKKMVFCTPNEIHILRLTVMPLGEDKYLNNDT